MFSLLEKSYLGCWVEVVETLFFPRRLMLNSDESSASGKTEKSYLLPRGQQDKSIYHVILVHCHQAK